MPEENQNMGVTQDQSVASPVSSLRAETNAFNEYKTMLKNATSKSINLRRADESKSLLEKSLTSTDQKLCSQYDRACKASEMARWIRKYWESQGYDWSNIDDVPLLNQYSQLFPNSGKIMKDYITRQDEDDPMPYYIKLGFEQPNEEDDAKNWLERTISNYWWSFDKAGQGLRTMWNDSNMYDKKWERGAIQDYAYDVYWRKHPFSKITEEEWKNVERDLRLDPTLLDKYKDPEAWIKDILLWGTVSAFNTNPWGAAINLGVSWAAATKPWEEVLWTAAVPVEKTGYYLNKLPWLRKYRDELPTDQDKRERDLFVWGEFWGLLTRWAIKNWKQFKGNLAEWGNWGGWWGWGATLFEKWQKQKQQKLQNQWETLAWKIGQWNIKDRSRVLEWLSEADLDWVKTYEELWERLEGAKNNIWEEKKRLASRNSNKYWETDLSLSKEVKTVDWVKPVSSDPFLDAIDALEKVAQEAWDRASEVKYKAYFDKIKRWEITQAELVELQAEFNKKFSKKAYDKNDKLKDTISAEASDLKRREMNEVMETLADKSGDAELTSESMRDVNNRYSSTYRTSELIDTVAEKVNAAKQKLAKRNLLQKATGLIWDLLDLTWVKNLIRKVVKNGEGEVTMSPLDLEKNLQSHLKKINNLIEKLDRNAPESEIFKLEDDARVWLTSVNGYEPVKSDALFKKGTSREKKWNQTKANEYYSKSLDAWEQVLRDAFWENITLEKGVGRYFGSTEPTHVINIPKWSPDLLPKITDLANNTFKQNSVFVARRYKWNWKGVKLWIVDEAKWTSNEVWVKIELKNPIEKMQDFDSIMNEIGQLWWTLSNGWKTIEIYNLSKFNPDRSAELLNSIGKIMDSPTLKKYGVQSSKPWIYEVQHIWKEWEWLGLYDAIK